jgi:ABC-type oligopeptide transport system substrate-binding subunit
MKKSKKVLRFVSLIIAFMVVASAAACGNNGTDPTSTTVSESKATSNETTNSTDPTSTTVSESKATSNETTAEPKEVITLTCSLSKSSSQ